MATYEEIVGWIKGYSHREDLDAQMPMFIELAHNSIIRDLQWQEMEQFATLEDPEQVEAQLYAYELPDRFFALRSVWVNGRPIPFAEPGQLRKIASNGGGEALRYSIVGSALWIAPGLGDVSIVYDRAPILLTPSQGTNEISAFAPQLYLYAGLAHLHRYVQDSEEEMKSWELFSQELQNINARAARKRSGATPAMEAV